MRLLASLFGEKRDKIKLTGVVFRSRYRNNYCNFLSTVLSLENSN